MWGNYCSSTHIALWMTIVIHSVLLSFFFLYVFEFLLWFFFQICFCRFHLLILRWLKIWLHNLFCFIFPLYKVSMVCEFARITQVALVYEYGVVSFFFNWTWFFYRLFFFSHIVKKKSFRKKVILLNFIKSTDLYTCLSG
jgi:hypothetical protein